MKRLTMIALVLVCAMNGVWAQMEGYFNNDRQPMRSSMERNFEMPELFINIRDFVHLPNKGRMVLELNNVGQYEELKGLDSVLRVLMQQIAFYKDSLANGSGQVSIYYTVDEAYSFSKIRFKKYAVEGDVYMHSGDDVAQLKLDQDTVRIYLRHKPVLPRKADNWLLWAKNYDYNHNNAGMMQVTFYVNSYMDLGKIAMDGAGLRHALDTLAATKRKVTKMSPYKFPSSAVYDPYSVPGEDGGLGDDVTGNSVRYKQYRGLVKDEYAPKWSALSRSEALELYANVGVGLVRQTLAPVGDIGMSFTISGKRLYDNKFTSASIMLYHSAYFFFEQQPNGDYLAKDNWFLNAAYRRNNTNGYVNTVGVGYLYGRRGDYLKGTTMKVYVDVPLHKHGLTLSPELIITDDMRQVIPSVTLKVF